MGIKTEKKIRVVHYLNPTFANLTNEEKEKLATMAFLCFEGARRLGKEIEKISDGKIEIVKTIVGEDNHVAERLEDTAEDLIFYLQTYAYASSAIDLFIAGPAFNAGRYGMACGALCKAVQEKLGEPSVTAMYKENPGVDQYKKDICIVRASQTAVGMKDVLGKIVSLGLKLVGGEEVCPEKDGYFPHGFRKNYFANKTGAERAIDALLAEMPKTEYPMPEFDRVSPAPPISGKVKIALVTSGGIVPIGNPDRIEASSAQKFGEYSLSGIQTLLPTAYQTAHGGYDATYANADPNRVLPVDVLQDLEREGIIELHEKYYATVGNGTSVGNSKKFGQEIARRLVADGVQAVILTST